MSSFQKSIFRLSVLLLTILLFPAISNAQLFTVNGDASDQGGGCYELTPNAKGQLGSIWSPNKVSLNNSFVVTGRLNFGTKPFWEKMKQRGMINFIANDYSWPCINKTCKICHKDRPAGTRRSVFD